MIVFISSLSIGPILVPHRQSVQFSTAKPPVRHELIHQAHEAGVVRRLQQVNHFMRDDVLKAGWRLFS